MFFILSFYTRWARLRQKTFHATVPLSLLVKKVPLVNICIACIMYGIPWCCACVKDLLLGVFYRSVLGLSIIIQNQPFRTLLTTGEMAAAVFCRLFAQKLALISQLHCKKELAVFPSPAGMSLMKLFLDGNNLVFSRRERVWSVTSRLGTGKWLTLFYSVYSRTCREKSWPSEGNWNQSYQNILSKRVPSKLTIQLFCNS